MQTDSAGTAKSSSRKPLSNVNNNTTSRIQETTGKPANHKHMNGLVEKVPNQTGIQEIRTLF